MKKLMLFAVAAMLGFSSIVIASPGRLDRNGCHRCTANCARYGLRDGEFHCHTRSIDRGRNTRR